MNNIKAALWQNYNDVNNRIVEMEIGTEEYDVATKERDNIRNELIKIEQIDQDTNVKISQIKSENKREKVRNVITVATFAISTIVSVCAINKTFKFDKEGTVTSTLGRNILNGVVPKLSKR